MCGVSRGALRGALGERASSEESGGERLGGERECSAECYGIADAGNCSEGPHDEPIGCGLWIGERRREVVRELESINK